MTETLLLQATPMILGLARIVAEFLQSERARTGLTTEEIFAKAGVTLNENTRKLLDDLEDAP